MKQLIFFCLLLGIFLTITSAEVIIRKHKDGSISVTHKKKAYLAFGYIESQKKYISTIGQSKYVTTIKSYARQYGFSEKIALAVAKVESDFNPIAVSKKGAIGIMQLMKDTALQYGVKNRYNARENIKAGIKHLRHLYSKYNQNLTLTLAAYNAGENAVKIYKGVPPYKETINFIRKVRKYLGMDFTSIGTTSQIYQYVTKDGKVLITDQYHPRLKQKESET